MHVWWCPLSRFWFNELDRLCELDVKDGCNSDPNNQHHNTSTSWKCSTTFTTTTPLWNSWCENLYTTEYFFQNISQVWISSCFADVKLYTAIFDLWQKPPPTTLMRMRVINMIQSMNLHRSVWCPHTVHDCITLMPASRCASDSPIRASLLTSAVRFIPRALRYPCKDTYLLWHRSGSLVRHKHGLSLLASWQWLHSEVLLSLMENSIWAKR